MQIGTTTQDVSTALPACGSDLPSTTRRVLGWALLLASLALLAALPTLAATEDPGSAEVLDPEIEELVQSVDPSLFDPTPSTRTSSSESLPPGYGGGGGGLGVQLLRAADPAYADGVSALAGPYRRSAREISNLVLAQSGSIPSPGRPSDMVWQWGQFVDHDVDLTEPAGTEDVPIEVPVGDPFFDPFGQGGVTIPFSRSVFDPATGTDPSNPRQQVNDITAFIDASNVYGSDPERTHALRTNDGTGRLKVSPGNFLPFNTFGLPNAGGDDRTDLFLAGDIRANEQAALTAMHTLWMREHNTLAKRIRANYPYLSGDQVFAFARALVAGEMQVITYRDFLPVLLGSGALAPYAGFNPHVDPGIINVFSTAAYRLGHTMLSPTILRLDRYGNVISYGHLPLRDAFFNPGAILDEGGIDPMLKGLASQVMQRIDSKLVDDVRNFLFGPPGAGGLDLASLNIQRGRDHGLPDYNQFRIAFGLTPAASFADITQNTAVQQKLTQAYGNVNDIDVWVGALAEDPVTTTSRTANPPLVGDLLLRILRTQFENLRDGDSRWYQNRFSSYTQTSLERQTLAKVIARNTSLRPSDLQANVFRVPLPSAEIQPAIE